MSGKPSPEGVKDFRATLVQLEALTFEIIELRVKAKRLKDAEQEYDALYRTLKTKLQTMDLHSTGNYGWEHRFIWFLAEYSRQVQQVATHPFPDPPESN